MATRKRGEFPVTVGLRKQQTDVVSLIEPMVEEKIKVNKDGSKVIRYCGASFPLQEYLRADYVEQLISGVEAGVASLKMKHNEDLRSIAAFLKYCDEEVCVDPDDDDMAQDDFDIDACSANRKINAILKELGDE